MKPANINLAVVLIALRNGFGVEDIAQGGIVTAKEARAIVADLRKSGTIKSVMIQRRAMPNAR